MQTTTLDEIRHVRPDIAQALDSLMARAAAATAPDFVSMVRSVMDGYGGADAAAASQGVEITCVDAAGVNAEYYVPAGCSSPDRLMYIHGGAWVGGDLKGYRALAATFCKLIDAPILLVDYRLAPEHPFPAGLDDCLAAYEWFTRHGPSGVAAARSSFLAGDSAGGNLAAATTIGRIGSGLAPPTRLALIAGVLDVGASAFVARHDPITGAESVTASLAAYTSEADAARNPLISPLCAADEVLAAFPPTILQASTDEFLMGCTDAFARRLRQNGVRTVLSAWPMVPHVWHNFLDALPEARAALDELARFLTQAP